MIGTRRSVIPGEVKPHSGFTIHLEIFDDTKDIRTRIEAFCIERGDFSVRKAYRPCIEATIRLILVSATIAPYSRFSNTIHDRADKDPYVPLSLPLPEIDSWSDVFGTERCRFSPNRSTIRPRTIGHGQV